MSTTSKRIALVSVMAATMIPVGMWTAHADVGVGVCLVGSGFSAAYTTPEQDQFVGVNVGQNSQTGAFTDRTAYETECCAEMGRPPDCFSPLS